ncbi:hypothetical protein Lser_V15G12742 [Lactuca serriola]
MEGFHIPGDLYYPNQGNGGWIEDDPEEDPEEEIPEEEPEEESEEDPEEDPDEESEEEGDDSLQAAAQKNAQTVSAFVDNLTSSLQAEKKHFEEAHQSLKSDNTELQTTIHDRLDKLEAELALENKAMDDLAL